MNTSVSDGTTIDGAVFYKMDYFQYLPDKGKFIEKFKYGFNRTSLFARLRDPGYLHRLYLNKDPDYFRYLYDFRDKYADFDVIIMNPGVDLVHPEFLHKHFKSAIKVLHFIDDPHMTYSYNLPFSWVFDGATYVSPSYGETMTMKELMLSAGFKWARWLPHCVTNTQDPMWTQDQLSSQLKTRSRKSLYIGSYYRHKSERLLNLKKELKSSFDIFGRFPLGGLPFTAKAMIKNRQLIKVKALTNEERTKKYLDYSVGINMHLSDPSKETGNARLYELPFHGIAQVADVSQHSLVEDIFQDGKEILLYRSLKECIDLTKMLLNDDKLRNSIALNGYKKTVEKYTMQKVLKDFIKFLKKI